MNYQAHDSAIIDEGAQIGEGCRIWHFSHICGGAKIGERCSFGQNTMVADEVVIGSNVKVQNGVSIYAGTTIEDDVFLGPSCVLTNVTNPRSEVSRKTLYEATLIKKGASVGANATIVCGVTIGRYAFIAAGAVVTRSVPDYSLVVGVPGAIKGWMSRHGHRLENPDEEGVMVCPESGFRYREHDEGGARWLDLDEEEPLPQRLTRGERSYREFRNGRQP